MLQSTVLFWVMIKVHLVARRFARVYHSGCVAVPTAARAALLLRRLQCHDADRKLQPRLVLALRHACYVYYPHAISCGDALVNALQCKPAH